MPVPYDYETKTEFIRRCIPILIDEGNPADQATAICHSIWKKDKE